MNWPQFAYQYGIGGAFFAVTFWLCARGGARTPSDRFAVRVLLAGAAGYLAVHALWIALAG